MKTITMTEPLYDYLVKRGVREHETLRRLREHTATMPRHNMQISPDQGAFMGLLVKLMGARRVVEIGTFTGYSALAMALALPEDGELVACDVSEEWTSVGRPYWEEAGVAQKIDLRIAPALRTLDTLLERGERFDLAFVDADKTNYLNYYEKLLDLIRPGGAILFDNVLWGGSILDEADQSEDTVALRALNDHLSTDERVELVMLPISDGVTIARVKG